MIFFFYGPNTYEARQQLAKMRAGYIKKTGGDTGLERIDGPSAAAADLKASLQAAPFLATSRLVIIEDLGTNKSLAPKAEQFIDNIPETTVAVFYDPSVDQRTTYFKNLSTAARTVKFEPLSSTKLHQWIKAEVSRQGGEIDPAAIESLLDRAGEDQWRLSNEIAKLVDYSQHINVQSVAEMVEQGHNETIFDLVEAMTAGQAEKAIGVYRDLLIAKVSEMYMLSMIQWQLRNLLVAKVAGKITAPQLARDAGMSPFVAGKMLNKRHLFSEETLKAAFVAAVDTEYKIKSGEGAAEPLVEQLILKTSQSANQQATR
ncbi:MAG TPA: DNA polymerase III subunit delta [Candidatus Saccharimonadales bacterium]|nr:DNA polymerase III subunit delta [Candidatus Saccharimonadales bacterium]